jgi:succinoglycan biosynthesis protein ExoA
MSDQHPPVTIGIPALNEEESIEAVLETFSKSNYPNIVEIIVADGGSIDKTREIIDAFAQKDPRVKWIDNPEKVQSFGLNYIIKIAKGEIFLRADAHCIYSSDYVEKSVYALLNNNVRNAGGAQRFIAENLVQAGIAMAVNSVFGSGGAAYRNPDYSGPADTVFLGCFYLEDLKKIEGYNVGNIVNEDAELNIRLKELKDTPVYVSSDVVVHYKPRNSLMKLIKQYYRYGRGRYITVLRHPGKSHPRGQLPFRASVFLLLLLILDNILQLNLYALPIVVSLLVLVLIHTIWLTSTSVEYFSNKIWRGPKDKVPGIIPLSVTAFVCITLMSVSHSFGYLEQMTRRYLFSEKTLTKF